MPAWTADAAALIADRWARMHGEAFFAVDDGEVHYLTGIALACTDELVAHLLLRKLKLAKKLSNDAAASLVRMNSLVEYLDGDRRKQRHRLLHPSAAGATGDCLSIASLTGAGLIGLREGQSILWPDETGEFRPIRILRVAGPAPANAALMLERTFS